ncbi:MAG: hypothetical protein IT459_06045 [Planctomycetes bacterium]|nr:hypothetical protein [Planctomycetota bacterium]
MTASNDPPIFAPEVEAMLVQAAADPNSLLMRVPRRHARAWSNDPAKSTQPGLGAIERHLLQALRSEVAEGLRAMCDRKLAEVRAPVRLVLPVRLGTARATLGESELLDEDARRYLVASSEWRDASRTSSVSGTAAAPLHDLSVEALAVLAQRFEPSPRSNVHAGLAALERREFELAAARFGDVIQTTSSAAYLSAAWSNLGTVHGFRGSDADADAAHRLAWALRPDNASAALSVFFRAIQRGDSAFIGAHAEGLSVAVEPREAADLSVYCMELRARRKAGLWTPTAEARELVMRLGDRFDRQMRRLFDEFQ